MRLNKTTFCKPFTWNEWPGLSLNSAFRFLKETGPKVFFEDCHIITTINFNNFVGWPCRKLMIFWPDFYVGISSTTFILIRRTSKVLLKVWIKYHLSFMRASKAFNALFQPPYKPIRDVPFFRVSFFSRNSWTEYENWSEIPKRVMTICSKTIGYCFCYCFREQ